MWQRIKRNAQGLRSACRTVETMDLGGALKGSLDLEHVRWMITVDTSTATLDELEDKVLTMGQHVDQVLSSGSSAHSSTFMSATSPKDIDIKLDNVTKQLSNLSAALLSSRSSSSNRNGGEGRGRGGGRSSEGRGKICWNCGGYHHILQCTRTLLKEKEKGDTRVTFDDESALFSHTSGLTLSHFISSHEDVYSQCDEVDAYSKNTEDEQQYNVAFLSSMCDDCCDSVDQNERDYSFLRLKPCDFPDDSDIEYETLDFMVMSNMNDVFIDVSGMDYLQSEDSVEPTALIAQVSYDNGDDSTN